MRVTRVVLACLLLFSLLACNDPDGPSSTTPTTSAEVPAGMDESLRDSALAVVKKRESALRRGDREAFLATVDPSSKEFLAAQAQWFDNLAQLPVTEVSLELGLESVMTTVQGEGDLQLPLDFSMQLEGFEARPVTQPLIYTFNRRGDEAVLANDRNLQYDALLQWAPVPWDLSALTVRKSPHVLGMFDSRTIGDADELMADLDEAATLVKVFVPSWSGGVIVYASSDVTAMDRWTPREVGSDTPGIAFPGPRNNDGVATYRLLVNPNYTGDRASRKLVFGREMVHIALQGEDRRAGAWLSEGIAQILAQSVMTPLGRRHHAASLLQGVEPRTLIASRDFYTRRSKINYALAALVCDYLATTRGFDVLQRLDARMRKTRGSWSDYEAVVRRQLGVSTRDLTRDALAWARSA